jgi:hypothetical protein
MEIIKTCSKCNMAKNIDFFHFKKGTKDGRRYTCKECTKIDKHESYLRNKETSAKYRKYYREENRIKCNLNQQSWRSDNKEKTNTYNERYKIKIRERAKKYIDSAAASYIKHLICYKTKLRVYDIPKELIELKRVQILITREIRAQK